MVNFRFCSSNAVKAVGLICASVVAWYMGYFVAEILPEDSLHDAIGSVKHMADKPVIIGPPPKRLKCAAWTKCSPSETVYRIRSGAAKSSPPEICFNDELLLGPGKNAGDRGLNFVTINPKTLKVIDIKAFDMYEGDFSKPMVEFIKKIPDGTIIMVASHDDAFTRLNEEAKKAFENLGSKQIRSLNFRSQFVFLCIKGHTIPEGIEKEKVIHSDASKNRHPGWPAEIQIDGCLPKK